jgi:hypothetical protein
MDFIEQDLTGARYLRCGMRDVVIRGSDTTSLEIDDPHLHEGVLWAMRWMWFPLWKRNSIDVS